MMFTDNASRSSQLLLRAILAYRFTDRLSAGGGYTYSGVDDASGTRFTEHRTVQDLAYHAAQDDGLFSFLIRVRLEERFREGETGTAVRLRQLVRMDVRVTDSGLKAVAWNETFYALNGAGWAGAAGPALALSFIGVSIPVSKQVTMEPGYLNFAPLNSGAADMRHVLSVFLSVRL